HRVSQSLARASAVVRGGLRGLWEPVWLWESGRGPLDHCIAQEAELRLEPVPSCTALRAGRSRAGRPRPGRGRRRRRWLCTARQARLILSAAPEACSLASKSANRFERQRSSGGIKVSVSKCRTAIAL